MTAQAKRAWNHNIHYYPLILDAVPLRCQQALDVGCGEGILARREHAADGVEYLVGDFLTYPFGPASFDLVASVAALHHMDAAAALDRMRELLRPGGRLAVVGSRLHRVTRGYWEISSPTCWPPPETYVGMRRPAERLLPGARYRRHLLWRYSLIWTKPAR